MKYNDRIKEYSKSIYTAGKIVIITIFLTFLLVSCTKQPVDIWDKFWDKIDNMKEGEQLSESDQKLIIEATEKEWQEVDKQTDK